MAVIALNTGLLDETQKWLVDIYQTIYGESISIIDSLVLDQVDLSRCGSKTVMLDFSGNPWGDTPWFDEQRVKIIAALPAGINYIWVRSDYNHYHDQSFHDLSVPVWLIDQHYHSLLDPLENLYRPRRYFVSCLNGRLAWFRYVIAHFLATKYDARVVWVTCHGIQHTGPGLRPIGVENLMEEIIQELARQKIDLSALPEFWNKLPYGPSVFDRQVNAISDPAYRDSYLNIVTESTTYCGFVTEKTFKPLRAGQFFLVYGAPGTISFLRRCGFDVFDDVFDYHRYDQIIDDGERLQALINMIEQMFDRPWWDIYRQNIPRFRYNQMIMRDPNILDFASQLILAQTHIGTAVDRPRQPTHIFDSTATPDYQTRSGL